ncbi:MAG: ATP-binding protein [Lacunisphaera sp.]
MPLETQRIDVHDVLRDALANIGPELTAKQHRAETRPRRAPRDRARRRGAAAAGVLERAEKRRQVHPRGAVTLRVATGVASPPDRITIEVTDDGLGMSPGELERAFEAFMQGEHASGAGSHLFGGLGLGLAISRRLVELHSGRITARSRAATAARPSSSICRWRSRWTAPNRRCPTRLSPPLPPPRQAAASCWWRTMPRPARRFKSSWCAGITR